MQLNSHLEEIKSKILLSSLIGKDVRLIHRGHSIKALCPFHQEKTPSFAINDLKGFYYCFGCGVKGDIFSYVMEKQRLNFMEALEKLAKEAGVRLPKKLEEDSKQSDKAKNSQLSLMEVACEWFSQQLQLVVGERAREYLKKREIDESSVLKFRLGYAPPGNCLYDYLKKRGFLEVDLKESGLFIYSDTQASSPKNRFHNRLIFPILSQQGGVIAFGGRVLEYLEPKYINSPETLLFQKKHNLYGLLFAHKYLNKQAIVVEGYLDVISLTQAGFDGVIAPLGTALTIEQLNQLWRYTPCPIICFDGDEAGIKASQRVADLVLPDLTPNRSVQFVFLPKGEDPDSLVKSGQIDYLKSVMERPTQLVDYLWQRLREDTYFNTPEQKLYLKNKIHSLPINDSNLKKLYEQDLLQRYYKLLYTNKKHKKFDLNPSFVITPPKNLYREKILLVSLINHPHILNETIESLMKINFKDKDCEMIREQIVNNYAVNPIDWLSYLQNSTIAARVEAIVNDQLLYTLAPFAHKNINSSEAIEGVKEILCNLMEKDELKKETQWSAHKFRKNFEEVDWLRLKNLKIQNLQNKG